jgi:dCMP deaminase
MEIPSGERQELCRGLHAEQNVIIQAAHHGVSIAGSTLFCTNLPCITCAKMSVQAGIKEIYYLEGYPDKLSLNMLEEAGVKVFQVDKKTNASRRRA